MSPFLPLLFGILASAGAYLLRSNVRAVIRISLGLCLCAVIAAVGVAIPALKASALSPSSLWLLDPLSGVLLLLIAWLYLAATIISIHYLHEERLHGTIQHRQIPLYFTCLHLFATAMMAAATLNHVLLMWVALEATTLSTVLLVSFYTKEGALEAAWKYLVLCSTGIALGLIGILLALHAAAAAGIGYPSLFSFTVLRDHARSFDPAIMRLSFVFLFIGFGTKIGFVPMHTWLPDAHSKTPAPISAMLSGILLSVALAMLLRFKLLTDLALGGSSWTNSFFLVFGMFSLVFPAFILLVQNNYKRMLAYSSIEHMGLMAVAIGLGPIGAAAAIMHLIGHALAKSLLFFGAGEIVLQWKSTKIPNIHGLLRLRPVLSILFLLGLLMLLGVPPSPLFASEFLLLRSGVISHPMLMVVLLLCLTMIFLSMLRHTLAMFASDPTDTPAAKPVSDSWNVTQIVMAVQLLLLCGLGIFFLTQTGLTFVSSIAQSFLTTP